MSQRSEKRRIASARAHADPHIDTSADPPPLPGLRLAQRHDVGAVRTPQQLYRRGLGVRLGRFHRSSPASGGALASELGKRWCWNSVGRNEALHGSADIVEHFCRCRARNILGWMRLERGLSGHTFHRSKVMMLDLRTRNLASGNPIRRGPRVKDCKSSHGVNCPAQCRN